MRSQTYLRSVGLLAFSLFVLYSAAVVKAQSPPSGPAGGDLSGTYPNPVLAADRVRKVGDTMTGVLTISLPNPGTQVNALTLISGGNALLDRGTMMKFHVPNSGSNLLGGQITSAWGASAQTYMGFSAYNNGGFSEIIRIDGRGRLGIGTTNPAVQLHVNNATAAGTSLTSGFGGGLLSLQDINGPVNAKLYQWRSEGGVFRMSLLNDAWSGFVKQDILVANSAGSIGIGTASPTYSLDVNGGASSFRAKASTGLATDTIASFENNTATKMIVRANGNVGIGTTTPSKPLDVVGDINASGTITGGNIIAKYQDVAEWVESSQQLAAGTVVILDPARPNQVITSTESYDTRVAGVVSAQPGIALGEAGDNKVLVATTGRVKIKVSAKNGPVRIGDLLVTSDQPGVAMKSQAVQVGGVLLHRPGTLIGKALEPLDKGTGEILVLLSLQ